MPLAQSPRPTQQLQQQQQQQRFVRFSLQPHLVALLLALVLLQQLDVYMCRHIAASKRLANDEIRSSVAADSTSSAAGEVVDKRTLIAGGGSGAAGQPEEIFSLSDHLESNYDEYPMVVPKRAALLLDRLMVALHHALEKERRRIGDYYEGQNGGFKPIKDRKMPEATETIEDDEPEQGSPHYNMYSDDDPSVIMDYDFKDLNSINRATGETLMAKSFQRRANVGDIIGTEQVVGGGGVALLTSAAAAGGAGGGGGGGGEVGVSRNNIGRMYWRCYFNAVSCF